MSQRLSFQSTAPRPPLTITKKRMTARPPQPTAGAAPATARAPPTAASRVHVASSESPATVATSRPVLSPSPKHPFAVFERAISASPSERSPPSGRCLLRQLATVEIALVCHFLTSGCLQRLRSTCRFMEREANTPHATSFLKQAQAIVTSDELHARISDGSLRRGQAIRLRLGQRGPLRDGLNKAMPLSALPMLSQLSASDLAAWPVPLCVSELLIDARFIEEDKMLVELEAVGRLLATSGSQPCLVNYRAHPVYEEDSESRHLERQVLRLISELFPKLQTLSWYIGSTLNAGGLVRFAMLKTLSIRVPSVHWNTQMHEPRALWAGLQTLPVGLERLVYPDIHTNHQISPSERLTAGSQFVLLGSCAFAKSLRHLTLRGINLSHLMPFRDVYFKGWESKPGPASPWLAFPQLESIELLGCSNPETMLTLFSPVFPDSVRLILWDSHNIEKDELGQYTDQPRPAALVQLLQFYSERASGGKALDAQGRDRQWMGFIAHHLKNDKIDLRRILMIIDPKLGPKLFDDAVQYRRWAADDRLIFTV